MQWSTHPLLLEEVIELILDYSFNPFPLLLVNRTWYLFFHHVYVHGNDSKVLKRLTDVFVRKDIGKFESLLDSMNAFHDYLSRGVVQVQVNNVAPLMMEEETNSLVDDKEIHLALSNGNVVRASWKRFDQQKEKKLEFVDFVIPQQKKKQGESQVCGSFNSFVVSKDRSKESDLDNDRFIVTGGEDCIVRIIDYNSGELLASCSKANKQPILSLALYKDKIFSASDGVYVIQFQNAPTTEEVITNIIDNDSDHEFEKQQSKPKPKKLTKEEEKKRDKELKKQYQKSQKIRARNRTNE